MDSLGFFFFFKQKTAYEMRISDWSSDVCSSDLIWAPLARPALDLLVPHLRDRAMVVCDNIVAARREYRDYLELVRNPANGFASVTLPFKGGLELSVRLIGEATPPEPG